jgi:tetratricopeptide (TPR) repeat protein
MKNWIAASVFIFMAITSIIFGNEEEQDWQEQWTSAIVLVKKGKYDEGICKYSQAIQILEETNQLDEHLYIYNNRAQAYLFADLYEMAAADFNKVKMNPKANATDKILAQWGIARSYALLNDEENFHVEFAKIKEIDPHYPKVESTKDYFIFRNFHSDSPCVKKNFANILVKMDVCESVQDVVFTNSGVCLVKRKASSCAINQPRLEGAFNNNKEADCKYWCDRIGNGALVMCANKFKLIKCQWLCIEVVEIVKSGCYWCCEGDGFYRNCVKPFEDFLAQVPCDPLWD